MRLAAMVDLVDEKMGEHPLNRVRQKSARATVQAHGTLELRFGETIAKDQQPVVGLGLRRSESGCLREGNLDLACRSSPVPVFKSVEIEPVDNEDVVEGCLERGKELVRLAAKSSSESFRQTSRRRRFDQALFSAMPR